MAIVMVPVVQAQQVAPMYVFPIVKGNLEMQIVGCKDLAGDSDKMQSYIKVRILEGAPVGDLQVTIHKARNLFVTQSVGTQDPFAEITIGQKKWVTKQDKDGDNHPKWGQQFVFKLKGNENEKKMRVEVINKNVVADAFIARAFIRVNDLIKNADKNAHWYRLGRDRGLKTSSGEVSITSEFKQSGVKHRQYASQQTKPAKSRNPTFRARLEFKDLYAQVAVEVCVWKENKLKSDKLLCQTTIALPTILLHNHLRNDKISWFALRSKDEDQAKEKTKSQVQIIFRFVNADNPFGVPPVQVYR